MGRKRKSDLDKAIEARSKQIAGEIERLQKRLNKDPSDDKSIKKLFDARGKMKNVESEVLDKRFQRRSAQAPSGAKSPLTEDEILGIKLLRKNEIKRREMGEFEKEYLRNNIANPEVPTYYLGEGERERGRRLAEIKKSKGIDLIDDLTSDIPQKTEPGKKSTFRPYVEKKKGGMNMNQIRRQIAKDFPKSRGNLSGPAPMPKRNPIMKGLGKLGVVGTLMALEDAFRTGKFDDFISGNVPILNQADRVESPTIDDILGGGVGELRRRDEILKRRK